jgi:uncharacterized protein (DUF2141 family)
MKSEQMKEQKSNRMYRFLVIAFLGFSSAAAFSQHKLDIEISGIRNNEGNIMLQLFDSSEKVLIQKMEPITDKQCIITISDLKAGKYAVRYYHDENKNGKMETNAVGKPTEGYGFSNNVIGKFGPPPFGKWLCEINSDLKIFLRPTY